MGERKFFGLGPAQRPAGGLDIVREAGRAVRQQVASAEGEECGGRSGLPEEGGDKARIHGGSVAAEGCFLEIDVFS
jgi:hypothetical protein